MGGRNIFMKCNHTRQFLLSRRPPLKRGSPKICHSGYFYYLGPEAQVFQSVHLSQQEGIEGTQSFHSREIQCVSEEEGVCISQLFPFPNTGNRGEMLYSDGHPRKRGPHHVPKAGSKFANFSHCFLFKGWPLLFALIFILN